MFKTTLAGQTTKYTTTISGERVRVEVLPIHASAGAAYSSTSGKANNKPNADITAVGNDPIVGVIVVAKSLDDVDDTISLLRTLLLLAGLTTLLGVLLGFHY